MKINNLEESQVVQAAIVCNDILLLMASYWLAYACIYDFQTACSVPYSFKTDLIIGALTVIPAFTIAPPVFLKRFSRSDKILPRVIMMTTFQSIFMFMVKGLMHHTPTSTEILLLGYAYFTLLVFIERILLQQVLKRSHSKGKDIRNVVLIGHPWYFEDIYATLNDRSLGYRMTGIFTRKEIPEDMRLTKLGERPQVMDYLRAHPEITDLYLAPDNDYIRETEEIYRYCENHLIRFYALPVFMEFLRKKMHLSHVGNTTLLSARPEPLLGVGNRLVKRAFDLLVSGIFLITLFPVIYLIAACIIKIQSPGPVLFKQKRNGMDGKEFYCLKFRSMHVNKDSDRLQATENDPRKFKFGDIMRRTNIDELPQFINVFLGDMSMVGPRPHMLLHTQEYSQLINKYMVRHLAKPGITGWAQVQGFRGETKTVDQMEDRVKADIWYIENWSFFLDIRIMWNTFVNMIRHKEKNAY